MPPFQGQGIHSPDLGFLALMHLRSLHFISQPTLSPFCLLRIATYLSTYLCCPLLRSRAIQHLSSVPSTVMEEGEEDSNDNDKAAVVVLASYTLRITTEREAH